MERRLTWKRLILPLPGGCRVTGQNGIKSSHKVCCAEQLTQMQGIAQPYASRGQLFKIQPN
ncbi:hypothetical protein BCEP27_40135 [Burkholderia cepacia]